MTGPTVILLVAAITCAGVAAALLAADFAHDLRGGRGGRHDFDGIGEWERCRDALAPAWWEEGE